MRHSILLLLGTIVLSGIPSAAHADDSVTFKELDIPPVYMMVLSKDHSTLYVSHPEKNSISVIDTKTGKRLQTLSVTSPRSLLVHAGKLYVSSTGSGTITIFTLATGKVESTFRNLPKGWILTALSLGPDKKHILLSGYKPNFKYPSSPMASAYLWDLKRGTLKKLPHTFEGWCTFTPDGAHMLFLGAFERSGSGGSHRPSNGIWFGRYPSRGVVSLRNLSMIPKPLLWFNDTRFFNSKTNEITTEYPTWMKLIPDEAGKFFFRLFYDRIEQVAPKKTMPILSVRPSSFPAWYTPYEYTRKGPNRPTHRMESNYPIDTSVKPHLRCPLRPMGIIHQNTASLFLPLKQGDKQRLTMARYPLSKSTLSTTPEPLAARAKVVFKELKLPPTYMMVASDDGSTVFTSHPETNCISMIDPTTGKVRKTIKAPAPKLLVARGGKLYASSGNRGVINVFNSATGAVENQLLGVQSYGGIYGMNFPEGTAHRKSPYLYVRSSFGGKTTVSRLHITDDSIQKETDQTSGIKVALRENDNYPYQIVGHSQWFTRKEILAGKTIDALTPLAVHPCLRVIPERNGPGVFRLQERALEYVIPGNPIRMVQKFDMDFPSQYNTHVNAYSMYTP